MSKVFAYNVQTGVRGELLNVFHCASYSSYGMKLPEVKIKNSDPDHHTFQVAGVAETSTGRKVVAQDFGRNAVIFCTGEVTAGEDKYWEWVILVTPLETA